VKRQGLTIIDAHIHFPYGASPGGERPKPEIAAYSKERNRRMDLEWDFPEREPWGAQSLEETADRWYEEAVRHDLEKVIFVTGGGNETLAKAVKRHPDRFTGLAHHPIWEPGVLDEYRRAVEDYGLVGYKVLGPRVPISFDDPSLIPLWEYAAEHRLPFLIHFGILGHAGGVVSGPNMSPLVIANVAKAYPEIPFIIPHFGCSYMHDLLQLAWAVPNVYVDTSGSNQWMRWLPYPMDLETAFRKYYELLGPEHIVFGSDSSWFSRGFSHRYLQDQVRACRHLNFKQEDMELIFGGNARRLFRLGPAGETSRPDEVPAELEDWR